MEYRNAQYNAEGTIEMEVNHPRFGWVPFTASPDDAEKHSRDLFEEAQANAAPYVAPPLSEVAPAARLAAKVRIDRAAGKARARYVSAGELVEQEYLQAKRATEAWRADGSPAGDIPADIQVWADAAGMTAEQAAQDIEATAAGWAQVLTAIRQIRLSGKSAIDAAPDATDYSDTAAPYIAQLDALQP